MRLLNLSLSNWRGVESRDLALSDGVTLIEGPNEIGKSTLVEAVRMLFSEMDSSKKREVKAIQPVGQDVGSSVTAKVQSGDYRFVYSKTYNKATQTSLEILAPKKSQLTGREAHEEVERILGETMDMALWDALLVEQGEKVALANFQDSAGLAKALDEAAGSSSTSDDDADLFGAVQTEYEKYFSLKTVTPKFSSLVDACETAREASDKAQEALSAVVEDAIAHQRASEEARRLTSQLPDLKAKLAEHETNWTAIESLQGRVDAKAKELESAQAIHKAAEDANTDRVDLMADIEQNEKRLGKTKADQEPQRKKAAKLKDRMKSAQLVTKDLKGKVKAVKTVFDMAQADERQLRNLETLDGEKSRLTKLDEISKDMKVELKTSSSIKVDDLALEEFRQAERRLDISSGKRDSAATIVSVTAEKKIDLEIGDEVLSLIEGDEEKRTVASEIRIRLPGVASFRLRPPATAAELQEEAEEAREVFDSLKDRLDVKDLEQAETLNEKRKGALGEVERLKRREEEILEDTSREEIEQSVVSWQAECDGYAEGRNVEYEMPKDLVAALKAVSVARKDLDDKEQALDEARTKGEEQQTEYDEVNDELRDAQRNLAGIQATLDEKNKRLEKSRKSATDDSLAKRAEETGATTVKLELEVNKLQLDLDESSPDSVEALLTNARDVCERADADLTRQRENLAILTDRLEQAQADGRFESMEAAVRVFEEREAELIATRRRAAAIELLWATLNTHRNSAREAYVKPLKEAIEKLGRIVFGAAFEVELGDDWSLISRTLHGKTLPFDDLSVGAKEQLGILTRLAAAQIVSKQGGVPLIMDDALGSSDPVRLETMGAAIAAAGKECQIIILTCTPGRFTHVGSADVVKF